jgi:hypothetical protein
MGRAMGEVTYRQRWVQEGLSDFEPRKYLGVAKVVRGWATERPLDGYTKPYEKRTFPG